MMKIVLATQSPRRHELFSGLDIPFTTRLITGIDERYPKSLDPHIVPRYIAEKKALAYKGYLGSEEIVLTADTVVVVDGEVLGKPQSKEEARHMLQQLSHREHQVTTGVALMNPQGEGFSFTSTTRVWFAALSLEEIDYYLDRYKPYDKAGAYGIQEWIGYVAIERIEGSFYNVMGLPVHRVYDALQKWRVYEKNFVPLPTVIVDNK